MYGNWGGEQMIQIEIKTIDTPAGKLTKTCLFCRHFYFTGGTPGYSEQTPGGDVEIGCDSGLWQTRQNDTASELRRCMLTAQFCERFISHVG